MKTPSYKLTVPRVVDHLRRDGLLKRLGACHRETSLTWVVGLPGAGKTSLVAAWVGQRDPGAAAPARCFWYRLESSDSDVAELFDALRDSQSGEGARRLPVWSPEHQADLADFSRRFLGELSAEPLTIVLDDCHRVADDAALFAMLEPLHEVAGENLRVILISRRPPPPSLARGVVGRWLSIIDELRLSPAEVRTIARAVRGEKLSEEETIALDAADGWLAHVLALVHGRGRSVSAASERSSPVGEFLAAELLAAVPKEHRASLRRLAELPEIPRRAPMPSPLVPEVARLLETLAAQRYFVDEAGPHRFRLHDLLRDALLARNEAEDEPATRNEVRRELARWVEASMPEASMQLRVAAGDDAGALALLATHGDRWLESGLHRTVHGWLRELPAPERDADRAALVLWRARALLPLEPEVARPLFAEARRLAVTTGEAERAYSAWCGEVSSYVVQWGAVQGLADLVDELEALEVRVGAPAGEMAFRTSADALTALMYGRAEDPRIVRYAESTARAVAHAPNVGARISAAAQLLIYRLWWAGDYAGGRALYDTFDAEVDEGENLEALPRLLWWSCASIVDWQCGKPEDCYSKVERGLALASSSGVHVRDFFLLTQGIFCALSQEDWSRAEAYLKQLARTERTHKRLDVMVHHFFRSWHSLCRGDAATALAHAETAWPIADAIGSMFHKVIVLSALAPPRVHSGDLDGAEEAYRAQLALAKSARNPTFSFIAFCAGAEIAKARGDREALAKQVDRMLHVKQLGGFHSGCGWRTPMMRDVLAFALEKGIRVEVARQWIGEKAISPPHPVPRGWPMPIRIVASEGLSVQVKSSRTLTDGKTVDDEPSAQSGKSARKLRELLAVLVAQRAGALHGDLTDWLWPDAEGDKAAASLKVAIHRLRQWLGSETVIVHEGRVSLNPDRVECDLWNEPASNSSDPSSVLAGFDLPPVWALRKRLSPSRTAASGERAL